MVIPETDDEIVLMRQRSYGKIVTVWICSSYYRRYSLLSCFFSKTVAFTKFCQKSVRERVSEGSTYFTWNYFWCFFLVVQVCTAIFQVLESLFCNSWMLKLPNSKFRGCKYAKRYTFWTSKPWKLISRKIWVFEKFWNFHSGLHSVEIAAD